MNEKHCFCNKLTIVIFLALLFFTSAVIFSYAGTQESEPNNSRYEACYINMGTTIYGSTTDNSGNDREDYFKFVPPASGTAILTLYADYAQYQPDITGAKVWISDSDNRQIADAFDGCVTASGKSVSFSVASGKTYYIRCCGSYYNFYEAVDYHFTLGYAKPSGNVTIKNTIANSARKTNTVVWDKSKIRGANGYEINWKARGASKWASRKVGNVTRGDTSGLTIGGLYEIRVRPYLALYSSSYVVYGSWSPTVYRYFYTTQRIRLASKSKGSFTMSWARDGKASGYQVLYTTNKNGSGAAKNIKTVGSLASSITVRDIKVNGKTTRLQSGRTYYVQVREYRKIGSKTYYGNISRPVAVKVK